MILNHFHYDNNAFWELEPESYPAPVMKTNDQKVAVITGGNRGLGLQTARELGRMGILAVLGVRDVEKGATAIALLTQEGIQAEAIRIEVADPSMHAEVRAHLECRYGRLDILVNNAAIWLEPPPSSAPGSNETSTLSIDILRRTFDTNFFGTVALTQCLLPLLRKSAAGRIVNVSSIQGSLTLHSDPQSAIYTYKVFGYDASKTALNAFTVHLAHELRGTPIKVNSAHPGWVRTEMGGEGANMDLPEGGKTSAQLATLPDDGPSGGYFHLGQPLPW